MTINLLALALFWMGGLVLLFTAPTGVTIGVILVGLGLFISSVALDNETRCRCSHPDELLETP